MKRIQELAQQATTYIEPTSNSGEGWWIFDKEKFADLLIQECMDICERLGDHGMDGHYCADEIYRRFK